MEPNRGEPTWLENLIPAFVLALFGAKDAPEPVDAVGPDALSAYATVEAGELLTMMARN
jgi:hypothetical protein